MLGIYTIYAKIAGVVALVVAILFGLWYLDHRGFVRGEATIQDQWDKAQRQATADTLKIQQANDKKLNESEQKYVDQKNANDALLADTRKSGGLFYTPTVCPVSVPSATKAVASVDPASSPGRNDSGTINLTEFAEEVEQLGHDKDELAIRLNAIAAENK
ncbi:hypothetical protein [Solimicrobium silvestre]|uniref:Bacteriophage Rz lysis protein n=1 Tax=Solimicrobium silvestre TaxID=2099400 RepID=A0A2S9GYA4_9BURK|nr:hypothetical protein [Solimicrobium silvestre]PRC92691.1 hypothetical protein S2091_2746 [Solimicrobium silvestre]